MIYTIIVNWNGWRDTLECLDSLCLCEETNLRVIVCDNGSTDGSSERLQEWGRGERPPKHQGPPWREMTCRSRRKPELSLRHADDAPAHTWATLVEVGENRGFAGGNNVGIDMALKDPACEFVFLLNNDTVVDPRAITQLKARMLEEPALVSCGATLLSYGRPQLVQGLGGFWRPLLARGGHIGVGLSRDKLPPAWEVEAQMSYVIGAAIFMRRSFVERMGRLYEKYFLYYEELEIAAHLNIGERQGWRPQAFIFHKEGASIGSCAGGGRGLRSLYYLSVNLLRFHARHAPGLMLLALARIAWEYARCAGAGDAFGAKVILRAVADFLVGRYRRGDFDLLSVAGPKVAS